MLKALIFAMLVPITAFASNINNVALVSSSTQFDDSQLPQIQQNLEQKGYNVSLQYLDQVISDFGYVNTDQKRAKDLIRALTDDNIDILWFVRGGGGALNLLPYLEQHKDELKSAKPKVLVGFSDVTALHHFVNQELGWPSIHGVTAATNLEMGGFNQNLCQILASCLKMASNMITSFLLMTLPKPQKSMAH
ncbi:LD-carboxypeptidase [Photobacterium damselae]